jgi:reactive intermediate/imine deaminase
MSIKRYGATKGGAGGQTLPFARAVEAGGFLYVSGQVGMVDGEIVTGGLRAETHQTFKNLLAILDEANFSINDVIKVNVWLEDPRDFWTFNKIYAEYFDGVNPARACVESRMMVDCKVEIDLVAYKEKISSN